MEENSNHNESQPDDANCCNPRSKHGWTSIQCHQSSWSSYWRFVDIMSFWHSIFTKNVDKCWQKWSQKLLTCFSVSYFKDVNGKKISNFDEVPVFKDPTEMSLNVLEVHYKFSKFQNFYQFRPSSKWTAMTHGPWVKKDGSFGRKIDYRPSTLWLK